jgi:pimeloyl-ACP methyl ester carboxylesterase
MAADSVTTGTTTNGPAAAGTDQPTVVLVHGAFADSSSWNGVIAELHRDGLPVIAPANPLRGLHEDAAYLRSVLDSVEGPIVLAGHSYGGSVLTEAAAGATGVRALVYIAGFLLDAGESTAELAGKYPGGELGPALNPVPFVTGDSSGTDLYIRQDQFQAVFAADVPDAGTALMAVTQRPITAGALDDTAEAAAWRSIPSWSLITTQDRTIPTESMRFMARRANATAVEIDASHAVAVSRPDAVADLIRSAVRETAREDVAVGAGSAT